MDDPRTVLPSKVVDAISTFPEYRMGANRIAVTLGDGSVVEDVIVAWGRQVVRVAGVDGCPFDASQVVSAEDRSSASE